MKAENIEPYREEKETSFNPTFEDVFYVFTDKEIKEFIKGYSYYDSMYKTPAIIAVHYPNKLKLYESAFKMFNSLELIKEFLKNNKGIVIYKIFKRKDEKCYFIKYFDGLKFKNNLEYIYNHLMVKFRIYRLFRRRQ